MSSNTLRDLEQHDDFVSRHNGTSEADVQHMLGALKLDSLSQLIDETVPEQIRANGELNLPDSASEQATLLRLRAMAEQNVANKSYIGMGYYDTVVPPVILRNVLENPGWYTAYTPYQPEISQGRLEALLNFQQMVTDLTGLDVANASLLDEATAAAEAMSLCKRANRASKSQAFFVDSQVHPQTLEGGLAISSRLLRRRMNRRRWCVWRLI